MGFGFGVGMIKFYEVILDIFGEKVWVEFLREDNVELMRGVDCGEGGEE